MNFPKVVYIRKKPGPPREIEVIYPESYRRPFERLREGDVGVAQVMTKFDGRHVELEEKQYVFKDGQIHLVPKK